MAYPKIDPMVRFMRKVVVDEETGCWLWQGGISNGYAMFGVAAQKTVRAARWIWEQTHGPIPDGHTIDHVKSRGCVHTHCVNPEHLEPVTHRVNILRSSGPAALNAVKTHCPQNHEYTPENTRVTKKGQRQCRTCERARNRRNYHRNKNR